MIKQKNKKIDFGLEVQPGFSVPEFFREWKQLKSKGHFPGVISVFKLEEQSAETNVAPDSDEYFAYDIK